MSAGKPYPLTWPEGWPRTPPYARKDARFGKAGASYGRRNLTYHDGIARIHEEITRLGVNIHDDCIISSNLKVGMSGAPRSDQREPEDPGVAAYWAEPGKPMRVLAIDIYTRTADNMAAIAATLDAMRAIERHGGKQIQERAFTGFDALPPPEDCWRILVANEKVARNELHLSKGAARQYILDAFRIAARAGASQEGYDMDRLVKARDEAIKQLGI